MIAYLEASHIQIQENSIGSSKLMCLGCNGYVERVNTSGDVDESVFSGTLHKPDHRWLNPQTPIGESIVGKTQNYR